MVTSSSRPLHYAVHRLVELAGGVRDASVVSLHPSEHCVVEVGEFDGVERPFTRWLGGTVVLSPLSGFSAVKGVHDGLTLRQWTTLLQDDGTVEPSSPRLSYAWHFSVTSPDALVKEKPVRL